MRIRVGRPTSGRPWSSPPPSDLPGRSGSLDAKTAIDPRDETVVVFDRARLHQDPSGHGPVSELQRPDPCPSQKHLPFVDIDRDTKAPVDDRGGHRPVQEIPDTTQHTADRHLTSFGEKLTYPGFEIWHRCESTAVESARCDRGTRPMWVDGYRGGGDGRRVSAEGEWLFVP